MALFRCHPTDLSGCQIGTGTSMSRSDQTESGSVDPRLIEKFTLGSGGLHSPDGPAWAQWKSFPKLTPVWRPKSEVGRQVVVPDHSIWTQWLANQHFDWKKLSTTQSPSLKCCSVTDWYKKNNISQRKREYSYYSYTVKHDITYATCWDVIMAADGNKKWQKWQLLLCGGEGPCCLIWRPSCYTCSSHAQIPPDILINTATK